MVPKLNIYVIRWTCYINQLLQPNRTTSRTDTQKKVPTINQSNKSCIINWGKPKNWGKLTFFWSSAAVVPIGHGRGRPGPWDLTYLCQTAAEQMLQVTMANLPAEAAKSKGLFDLHKWITATCRLAGWETVYLKIQHESTPWTTSVAWQAWKMDGIMENQID
jgi:hypothetical protein